MTGLCGWIGPVSGDPPPAQLLDRMVAGLPGGAVHRGCALATAALHAQGWDGGCWLEAYDECLVAIAGAPRWESPDLARCAAERGHAAALKAAYQRDGRDLFRHLRGPFSLAIVEPASGKGLLAIDRFGVHTLCYAEAKDGTVVFGSTAEAVRTHPSVTSTIPAQAIFNCLFLSVCPAPTTIYTEQRKLLPGQCLWIEDGRAKPDYYWQMPYGADDTASFEDRAAELKYLLNQSVRRAIQDEEPATIGAFLSGGLDSSTIAGELARQLPCPPKTFTVAFEKSRYDESYFANVAARHFASEQREYRLTPQDMLDFVPRIAEQYDEPFTNSSAIPAYYCARMARDDGVALMVAGDGGDEIFAGNSRYIDQMVFDAYQRVPAAIRSTLVEPLALRLPLTDRVRLLRKARNYVVRARTPMPERLETYNFWLTAAPSDLLHPDRIAEVDPHGPISIWRDIYDRPGLTSLLHRMLNLDMTAALADNDLRKVNRMCWLAGVRVRYPFLDEDLAEFAARVPPRLLIRHFRLRDFYKRAMRDVLPPETVSKNKQGFGIPFQEWLKEHPALRTLATDAVTAFKGRRFLNDVLLDRVIGALRTEAWTPYDDIIWDIMILEHWLDAHESAARDPGSPRTAAAAQGSAY